MSDYTPRYAYEDFTVGSEWLLPAKSVEAGEIIDFATRFDPQPSHLDEAAGKASILGGLAASGWHTVSMFMRMMCDAYLLDSTSQGAPGIDYAKWKKPVLAGDTLTGKSTVIERRVSKSKPDLGMSAALTALIGIERDLGTHTFTAEEIVTFARKYDPQRFHVDPEAARHSNFGALCASGWHTTAIWMRLNVEDMKRQIKAAMERGETPPQFGPSPGFENLKWLKPVYAGDTIRFTRTLNGFRALQSRPGWAMMQMSSAAYNQDEQKVLEFNSAALIGLA
jgi:acyl dehydratase